MIKKLISSGVYAYTVEDDPRAHAVDANKGDFIFWDDGTGDIRHFIKDVTGSNTNVSEVVTTDSTVPKYINSNTTIERNGKFDVDTSDGEVTLTVGSDVTYFEVYDAEREFNDESCYINFGGSTGMLELDSRNDYFIFYKSGSIWRFKQIDQDSSGEV